MENQWQDVLQTVVVNEAASLDGLQIFGLKRGSEGTLTYTTLDEAVASAAVEITEVTPGGSVPHLKVSNRGETKVFVMHGEQLIGAKQNRAVNASVIVGPKGEWIVDVSCVERGRWGHVARGFRIDSSSAHARLRRMQLRNASAFDRSSAPGYVSRSMAA